MKYYKVAQRNGKHAYKSALVAKNFRLPYVLGERLHKPEENSLGIFTFRDLEIARQWKHDWDFKMKDSVILSGIGARTKKQPKLMFHEIFSAQMMKEFYAMEDLSWLFNKKVEDWTYIYDMLREVGNELNPHQFSDMLESAVTLEWFEPQEEV